MQRVKAFHWVLNELKRTDLTLGCWYLMPDAKKVTMDTFIKLLVGSIWVILFLLDFGY